MFQLIPINTEVYSIPAKFPPFHEENFMISMQHKRWELTVWERGKNLAFCYILITLFSSWDWENLAEIE